MNKISKIMCFWSGTEFKITYELDNQNSMFLKCDKILDN